MNCVWNAQNVKVDSKILAQDGIFFAPDEVSVKLEADFIVVETEYT